MLRNKTKIVATLGPSSNDKETILSIIKAGANVLRINFSHSDEKSIREFVKIIREINADHGINIAILGDLQGPKIRIDNVEDYTFIKKDDFIDITSSNCLGNSKQISVNYKNFHSELHKGETILIDDGKIILEVIDVSKKDKLKAKVIQGGELKSKKGINLPNSKISIKSLSDKDIKDTLLAIELKIDWIALSFVRNKKDLIELRELISSYSSYKLPIIAKIEKPEALDNLKEIIQMSEGIMVARGDLGIEISPEEVPMSQKKIIKMTKKYAKPAIVATQMMESMIHNILPTRAEVNDVANSILDGADAVMLSGETAVGKNPSEVVKQISNIISKVEIHQSHNITNKAPKITHKERDVTNFICFQAACISELLAVKAILTMTNSGYTAFRISSYRPSAYTIVFTDNKRILNMLNLLWGVYAIYYDKFNSTDETIEDINRIVKEKGLVNNHDKVINLSSMPIKDRGIVNTLRISQI